jgi:hypothetical protein
MPLRLCAAKYNSDALFCLREQGMQVLMGKEALKMPIAGYVGKSRVHQL